MNGINVYCYYLFEYNINIIKSKKRVKEVGTTKSEKIDEFFLFIQSEYKLWLIYASIVYISKIKPIVAVEIHDIKKSLVKSKVC